MLRTLLVGGSFDHFSGIQDPKINQIAKSITKHPYLKIVNGGNISELYFLFEEIKDYERIIWTPKILVSSMLFTKDIKKINSSCLLITFTSHQVSNLKLIKQVMFNDQSDLIINIYNKKYTLYDFYGNQFIDTEDISEFGKVLDQISLNFGRFLPFQSRCHGDLLEIPQRSRFIRICNKQINKLQKECSFISAFYDDSKEDLVFITKDDYPYTEIEQDNFIPVLKGFPVFYFGKTIPPKITPLFIHLFRKYKNAKYIIFSEAMIVDKKEEPLTYPTYDIIGTKPLIDFIINHYPDNDVINFKFIIQDVGSVVVTDTIKYFEMINYEKKSFPNKINLG